MRRVDETIRLSPEHKISNPNREVLISLGGRGVCVLVIVIGTRIAMLHRVSKEQDKTVIGSVSGGFGVSLEGEQVVKVFVIPKDEGLFTGLKTISEIIDPNPAPVKK